MQEKICKTKGESKESLQDVIGKEIIPRSKDCRNLVCVQIIICDIITYDRQAAITFINRDPRKMRFIVP